MATSNASDPKPAAAQPAAASASPTSPEAGGGAAEAGGGGLEFVLDVPLRLTVEVGSARMLVRDLLQLEKGAVVELDRTSGEPADVLVNGRLVGRGDVTVVDDRIAVRLTEVVAPAGTPR